MAAHGLRRLFLTIFIVGAALGLAGGVLFGGPDDPSDSTEPGTSQESLADAGNAPMDSDRAREIGANELGRILVLEYHLIGSPAAEWTRSPEEFRQDIDLLISEGFFPINVRDLATGNIEVPAGKSPVAVTFDDSSPGQYRILDDGTTDPDSAVGIMEAAVRGGGWTSRASFYVLLDVRPDDHVLFGQPDYATQKLQSLAAWGYEIGGQTVTHLNLREASTEEATKQLATSSQTIEELVGDDYKVMTLAVPFGEYPEDESILRTGTWDNVSYSYIAALDVAGGPAPSPFSTEFDPMRIPRIAVQEDSLRAAIQAFKDDPSLRYVSDGDPAAVSVPLAAAEDLGTLRTDLGRPVITY